MSRLIYLIVLAYLLSSCSLFKTKKSLQSTDVSNRRETEIKSEQRLLVIRDSLAEDFIVEIVPIGNFIYSLNDGFKGSGSAIKITGRKNSNIEVLAHSNKSSIHHESEKKRATQAVTDTVVKRDGLKLKSGFYYAIAFLLIGFLVFFWRKNYLRSSDLE